MAHQGSCDVDIEAGKHLPSIAAQLAAIDPGQLRLELGEYGAWSAAELADHDQNLSRILWLVAGKILDEKR